MGVLKLEVGKTYINTIGHPVKIRKYVDGFYFSDDDIPYYEDGNVHMSGRKMEDHKQCINRELKKPDFTPPAQSTNNVKNKASTHYELWTDMEAIDIIKTILTYDEYIGFLKGNILKYQLRLGKKDNTEKEIIKIQDYKRELEVLLKDES